MADLEQDLFGDSPGDPEDAGDEAAVDTEADLFGEESGEDEEPKVRMGRWALHDAAEAGDLEVLRTVLDLKAQNEGEAAKENTEATEEAGKPTEEAAPVVKTGKAEMSEGEDAENEDEADEEGDDDDSDEDYFDEPVLKIERKDWDGLTPLQLAILNARTEAVKLLISAGANHTTPLEGNPALHLCLRLGATPAGLADAAAIAIEPMMRALLEAGADVNGKDDEGNTPLHLAALYNLPACVALLLRHPGLTSIDAVDSSGRAPLHLACMRDGSECLRLLLNAKASVQVVCNAGQNALHVCARRGFEQGGQIILEQAKATGCKAALTAQEDQRGRTPAQWAERRGQAWAGSAAGPDCRQGVAILNDDLCIQHMTAPRADRSEEEPPCENTRRLAVLVDDEQGILRGPYLNTLATWHSPGRRAAIVDVLKCHNYPYVRRLQTDCAGLAPGEIGELDPDTTVCDQSFEAAMVAAGSVCEAVDMVCGEGPLRTVFCAVRPPGHHAGPNGTVTNEHDPHGSMGFCLLNNVAIGAAYARGVFRGKGVRKVAMLDFDVHHGNGTEAIVRNLMPELHRTRISTPFSEGTMETWTYKPWLDETDGNEVFFASVNGYGKKDPSPNSAWFYPGSGGPPDQLSAPIVINAGIRLTPDMAKSRRKWRSAWRDRILPSLVKFDADLIFISAGFDGHAKDVLNHGYLGLIEEDYTWLTDQIRQVANSCCDGRLVSVLEGGYRIQAKAASAFARSVEAHLLALAEPHGARYSRDDQQWEVAREREVEMERLRLEDEKLAERLRVMKQQAEQAAEQTLHEIEQVRKRSFADGPAASAEQPGDDDVVHEPAVKRAKK